MTTRQEIVGAAIALIGTPFVMHGRVVGPNGGVDCAGELIVVARQLGIVSPDFDVTGYTGVGDGRALSAYCDEHLVPVRAGCEQAGDVALLHWGAHPHHLAILVPYRHGGLSFVHALGPSWPNKVVETRMLGRMGIVAAYSFPGVD